MWIYNKYEDGWRNDVTLTTNEQAEAWVADQIESQGYNQYRPSTMPARIRKAAKTNTVQNYEVFAGLAYIAIPSIPPMRKKTVQNDADIVKGEIK